MIESHEGRVVEIIGDAFLAVFESAVRAVETGIAIQEGFKEYNLTCPEAGALPGKDRHSSWRRHRRAGRSEGRCR